MTWPWSKKQPATTRVEIIRKDVVKLQLSDWQKDKTLVAGAQAALNGDFMRLVVQVLKNEHPGHVVLPKNFPIELRSAHQSQCEGYTMALANLEAMGTLKEIADLGEPTFEREEPTNE